MKIGDMIAWTWNLQADSWEATRFTGIVLHITKVATDVRRVDFTTVLHVLDNTGQQCMVAETESSLEVISESR